MVTTLTLPKTNDELRAALMKLAHNLATKYKEEKNLKIKKELRHWKVNPYSLDTESEKYIQFKAFFSQALKTR